VPAVDDSREVSELMVAEEVVVSAVVAAEE
jgi:hypothetical protein